MSIDFVVWLLVGAVTGWLGTQIKKGTNIVHWVVGGIVGSVASGVAFDMGDFMDVGDIADPAIAGFVGAVIAIFIMHIALGTKRKF